MQERTETGILPRSVAVNRRRWVKLCRELHQASERNALELLTQRRLEVEAQLAEYVWETRMSLTQARQESLRGALEQELLRLSKHPQVDRFVVHEKGVDVWTEMLCCVDPQSGKKHEIGEFLLQIYFDGSEGGICFHNLTRQVRAEGVELNAPGVFADGRVAFLPVLLSFAELIARFQLGTLVDLALQFIELVDVGSFEERLLRCWPLVEGEELGTDHLAPWTAKRRSWKLRLPMFGYLGWMLEDLRMRRQLPVLDPSRHSDLFLPQDFNPKRIDVIGVGAVGSHLALQLAALGVSCLHLWDPDIVGAENVAPSAYGLDDLGLLKVEALQRRIKAKTGTQVAIHAQSAGDSESFGEVVFLLTDTMASRELIWRKSLRYRLRTKLVIETRMGLDAGRVYAVNPTLASHVEKWEGTLCRDEEAEDSLCGASRAVGATAQYLASVALFEFLGRYGRKYCAPDQLKQETLVNLQPLKCLTRQF